MNVALELWDGQINIVIQEDDQAKLEEHYAMLETQLRSGRIRFELYDDEGKAPALERKA